MKKKSKIISLLIIFLLVSIGIGFTLYDIPKKASTLGPPTNETHSYIVTWRDNTTTTQLSEYVDKNSEYLKKISFNTPNLKEIYINLSWTDDKATCFNRRGLDTLVLQITTPDGKIQKTSAKSASRTKQGTIEMTIPVNTVRPTSFSVQATNTASAEQMIRDQYYDNTWVDEEFTINISVKTGELRLLKRFTDQGNDFQLHITSRYSTESLTEQQNSGSDPFFSTGITSTDDIPSPLTAHISASTITGIAPLVVHLNGNYENTKNITSYRWDFGPKFTLIVPESKYRDSLLLPYLFYHIRNRQYYSSEQNPVMVFLQPGHYWARLTITDTNGNTASDIVWITVYVIDYPDND
jgi:hypothetical protein